MQNSLMMAEVIKRMKGVLDNYEGKVKELSGTVEHLRKENRQLKRQLNIK